MYRYTYIHIHTYTFIHTYIYIHTYTYICVHILYVTCRHQMENNITITVVFNNKQNTTYDTNLDKQIQIGP